MYNFHHFYYWSESPFVFNHENIRSTQEPFLVESSLSFDELSRRFSSQSSLTSFLSMPPLSFLRGSAQNLEEAGLSGAEGISLMIIVRFSQSPLKVWQNRHSYTQLGEHCSLYWEESLPPLAVSPTWAPRDNWLSYVTLGLTEKVRGTSEPLSIPEVPWNCHLPFPTSLLPCLVVQGCSSETE